MCSATSSKSVYVIKGKLASNNKFTLNLSLKLLNENKLELYPGDFFWKETDNNLFPDTLPLSLQSCFTFHCDFQFALNFVCANKPVQTILENNKSLYIYNIYFISFLSLLWMMGQVKMIHLPLGFFVTAFITVQL